jgi:hypothetical protein
MRHVFLLVVALAAACGDRGGTAEEAPPPDTAGGRPDLSRPDIAPRVMVIITDSAITLSQDSVEMTGTGQITLAVVNQTSADGQFKIEGGAQGDWQSSVIPVGGTVFMAQLLGRGTYELLWPADGSKQKKNLKIY